MSFKLPSTEDFASKLNQMDSKKFEEHIQNYIQALLHDKVCKTSKK